MDQYHAFLHDLNTFTSEIEVLRNEPLAKHTSFRIGGPADLFLQPNSIEALRKCLCGAAQQRIAHTVLGNGSNILVADEGYRGAIISTGRLQDINVENTVLEAQAGALLSVAARAAREASLTGMEFAAGIPGSIGGAVFMNAGAYDGQMADIVQEVRYLNAEGELCKCAGKDCEFAYRSSVFKHNPSWTIVSAQLALRTGDASEIRAKMEDLARRRREKQPLEMPSAGSTFKRPTGYFAGKLIQDAGLQGMKIGGAQVSEKHAGFVINRDGATCADVRELIETIQRTVQEKFNVKLECEMRFL